MTQRYVLTRAAAEAAATTLRKRAKKSEKQRFEQIIADRTGGWVSTE
jgi:hypothetical protein